MNGAIDLGLNATVESVSYAVITGPVDNSTNTNNATNITNTTIPNDSSSAVDDPTYIIENTDNI